MQNKGHYHVYESRIFSKRSTWCKQTLTPNRRALTKSRHELIPRHNPQMLITRIVRKLYPRDPKHICNKLWCDRNARTSNVSEEKRYRTINPMHVGVKLLDKYERTGDWDITKWLPSPIVNDRGKVSVGKVRPEWMPRIEKFSENALKASSSWNRTWEGEGLEDEKAPEQRGFRAGVDLRLGAIDTTNVNRKRGRERKDNQKSPKQHQIYQVYWKESTYAWEMHEHVTCKTNCIMGSAQSKPVSTQTDSTHLNPWQYYYNANVMQCMRF